MVNVDGSSLLVDSQAKSSLKVGGHMALSLHSSNETGELSQWRRHDDSTINIVITISIIIIIIRPHCSTMYIDTAHSYRPTNVVCLSVGRSVCLSVGRVCRKGLSVDLCQSVYHSSELSKNGCTDRDAVCVEDSGGPKEPRSDGSLDPPREAAILRGERGVPL